MEISKGSLRIETNTNTPPCHINLIGFNVDEYIIFKYNLNTKIQYVQYCPEKKVQHYLFFEIINKSNLWEINYNISPYTSWNSNIFYFDIKFTINININLINDYIYTSLALNYILYDLYSQYPIFSNTDFTNKSIIPYINSVNPPKNFKIKLYNYQQKTLAKMLEIEKNEISNIVNYTCNINFKEIEVLFDPISNIRVDNDMFFNISSKGGILADEMGLGKTISCIALILTNPSPINLPLLKMKP